MRNHSIKEKLETDGDTAPNGSHVYSNLMERKCVRMIGHTDATLGGRSSARCRAAMGLTVHEGAAARMNRLILVAIAAPRRAERVEQGRQGGFRNLPDFAHLDEVLDRIDLAVVESACRFEKLAFSRGDDLNGVFDHCGLIPKLRGGRALHIDDGMVFHSNPSFLTALGAVSHDGQTVTTAMHSLDDDEPSDRAVYLLPISDVV